MIFSELSHISVMQKYKTKRTNTSVLQFTEYTLDLKVYLHINEERFHFNTNY